MAKTSKTISQKEKASSSQPAADKTLMEPLPDECVPGACVLTSDFKVDKGSPSSVEEEASASDPKPVKDNKRKRAFASEDPKLKMRMARKLRKNTIPLTVESVLRLRDEDEEEEEENDGSVLVARMKKTIGAPKAAESMVIYKALPQTKEVVAVHREACSRSRAELHWFEADLRRVTEERSSLRLLSGQREEEIKGIRAELAKAHQDQTDLNEQLQEKLETIGQLREEVEIIRAEIMGWKDGMDRLATEKKTVWAQLSSTARQLQGMKEKISVQARRIEELEARLASELAKAKSDAEKAKSYADALVAVYRADAEVAQVFIRF
ncbi:uncharacterized protein [Nicotiana tomentosiformis]|uniref:uncharacterized protein n=1 Tax=Nicotiana tomentosiformis TaxID=4098 RepID=UPI00388C4BBC